MLLFARNLFVCSGFLLFFVCDVVVLGPLFVDFAYCCFVCCFSCLVVSLLLCPLLVQPLNFFFAAGVSYLAGSALLALIKSEKPDQVPFAYPYSSYAAYSPSLAVSASPSSAFSRPVYAAGHPFAMFSKQPPPPLTIPKVKKEQSTLCFDGLWLAFGRNFVCFAVGRRFRCVFCLFGTVSSCGSELCPVFDIVSLRHTRIVSCQFCCCSFPFVSLSPPPLHPTVFAALFSPRSPLRAGAQPKSKFGLSQEEKERTFIPWAREEDQVILQTVNLFGHNWFLAWHMLQLNPRLAGRMRSQKDVYLRYQTLTSKKGQPLLSQHGLTAGLCGVCP